MVTEYGDVDVTVLGNARLQTEPLSRRAISVLAETSCRTRRLKEPLDGRCDRARIPRWHHEPRFVGGPRPEKLTHAADIGGDDWDAGRHRLEHHHGACLRGRAQDENVDL